jgi:lipid-binding SYLF domain-containing protein
MGAGFVIAHLPDGAWSAPAFFQWHGRLSVQHLLLLAVLLSSPSHRHWIVAGVGGGITFGISKADSVIILNSDRALAQYASRDMNFKFGE